MSEQEGTIVEAVEESVSVIDAAPEAPSNPNVAEAAASAELDTASLASDNGSSPESSEATTSEEATSEATATPESEPALSIDEADDGGEVADASPSAVEVVADAPATDESATETAAEAPDTATAEASSTDAPTAETSASSESAPSEDASTSDDAPATDNAPAAKADKADKGGKKVVRTLAVGQEVSGTVKRLTEFGAFVDLGVGRDGLLHVSELSVQRVNKVSDVLSQGQEVTVWIKELNREKNRISLTLISPDTKTIRDINKDDILEGTVTRMTNFGAFVDIGIGRDALLHVREMAEGFVKRPEDVVSIGETFEVRIVELNRRRGRVDLSIKGLRPEPESAESPADAGFADGEEEFVDAFENVEPMSAIELALKRAMEGEGDDSRRSKRAKRKEKRNRSEEDEMDDIISRTLSSSEL